MQKLIHFISASPDWPRFFILVGTMFFCWNVEYFLAGPLRRKKWKHAFTNVLFVLPAIPVQFLLGFAFMYSIHFDTAHHFGLLQWQKLRSTTLLDVVIAVIILDFFEYVYHVGMHRIKKLWMFHLIHHSDRDVDVSTTLREHPVETFVRLSFSIVLVLLLGIPFWIVLFRQWIQIAFNVFQHAGFRLPVRIDSKLRLVFVTPNMHHVHHHFQRPQTDSNYGDIFSIWDRLFGTFRRYEDQPVKFGIDTCMDPKENTRFLKMMKIPFGEYRKEEE